MSLVLSIIVIILSGVLGWYLDTRNICREPTLHWVIGGVSVGISCILIILF